MLLFPMWILWDPVEEGDTHVTNERYSSFELIFIVCISMHFCEQMWLIMHFHENYRSSVCDLNNFLYLLLDINILLQVFFVMFFLYYVFFNVLHSQFPAVDFHRCNFTCPTSKFLSTYLPSLFWTWGTFFLFKTGANKCRRVSLAWSFIFQFKFSWRYLSGFMWLHFIVPFRLRHVFEN